MRMFRSECGVIRRLVCRHAVAATLLVGVGVSVCRAADWPVWRGTNKDGISAEAQWDARRLATPQVLWKTNVGQGWSAATVSGKRLYTMGNRGGKDTVYCLSSDKGLELWKFSYNCGAGNYPGPRATPVLDGDLLYVHSREGHVFCLDADTGGKRWERNIARDFRAATLRWGLSGSPCVHGDLVLFNAGQHGAALNKKTGATVWSSAAGAGGYSTPVVYRHGGGEQVAMFGSKAVHGVDVKTGKRLWSFDWVTKYDVNAADPIYSSGRMFISSGYGKGCALLDLRGRKPRQLWTHKNMKNHFSTCVLRDGHLYGVDGNAGRGAVRCLDFSTGAEKWSRDLGFGSLIMAGDKLLILNEKGRLFVASATPDAYREIAQCQALKAGGKVKCWTMPVLANGRLYCRNSAGDMVCLNVAGR